MYDNIKTIGIVNSQAMKGQHTFDGDNYKHRLSLNKISQASLI
jgi:hypothetical protein